MAGPNLPENVASGGTGHVTHHNSVHDVVNRFDISETPAVGEALRWDGSVYTPQALPAGGASAAFDAAFGHRYVDYVNGSDTDDGISPATAKKNLQAAHDALPSNGGIVWAAPGIHQISSQVNWTKTGAMLIGAGRSATSFRIVTNGIHGIKVTANYPTFMDFKIGDQSESSGINARSAIYCDGSEWPNFTRIRFDQLAEGQADGADFDNGGAGLRLHGVSKFGDWGLIDHCEFRACYRGFAASSSMNGWVSHCSFFAPHMEHVYIYKQTNPFGQSVAWRFSQCQWVATGPSLGYQVRLDHAAGALTSGTIEFLGCVTEQSGAGGGYGSYYINLQDVILTGCRFTVTDATGPTIRVGPDGQAVCGPYVSDGTPVFQRASTGQFTLWQPSNYTGTATVV